jgi:transposase
MTWRPEKLTRAQMAERRREGASLVKEGKRPQAAIARELGVSEAAVSQWKAQLTANGGRLPKARTATGRPAKLSQPQQRRALVRILKRGAREAGFPTERWTQQRIQTVIASEFAVDYHPNYVGRLLQQLGWSVQKPEAHAREQDEELIRAWLSHDWPRIKKSAAARRRHRI